MLIAAISFTLRRVMPTRSQIEAYTTDHLVDAAEYWDGLADRWEDAHWQVRNQAHSSPASGCGSARVRRFVCGREGS